MEKFVQRFISFEFGIMKGSMIGLMEQNLLSFAKLLELVTINQSSSK